MGVKQVGFLLTRDVRYAAGSVVDGVVSRKDLDRCKVVGDVNSWCSECSRF